VRREVCHAFVTLTEIRIDFLLPEIRNVVNYILHATQDQDEQVALEACEFWSAIAETKICRQVLEEFLPR
jgi:transportin-1